MTKGFTAVALGLLLYAGTAAAQTCGPVPNTLTNGTTADATQVMANFNYVLNCINGLRGYLGGLTMSNDGTNPNTVIDTSAGVANSDDNTTMMTLGAVTKNANAAWVVGSGNGCLDTGSSLAANTWYSLFVIARTDTGVVDELCSQSASSPSLPGSYTKKRRIGSFKTDGSAHVLGFSQNGDEFLWVTTQADVSTNSLGTTPTLFTISTPLGVKTTALMRATGSNSAATWHELLNSPDESAVSGAGANTNCNLFALIGEYMISQLSTRTNSFSQIRAVSDNANSLLSIQTYGWIDSRGRYN